MILYIKEGLRMNLSGTVLCYLPAPTPWEKKLRPALAVAGAGVKRILPEEAGETVGALAGLRGYEKSGGTEEAPNEPVLILCGLTGPRLDAALNALRRAGVPRSVYKAVVTGENAKWTFAALCRELRREREAMEQGGAGVHSETADK